MCARQGADVLIYRGYCLRSNSELPLDDVARDTPRQDEHKTQDTMPPNYDYLYFIAFAGNEHRNAGSSVIERKCTRPQDLPFGAGKCCFLCMLSLSACVFVCLAGCSTAHSLMTNLTNEQHTIKLHTIHTVVETSAFST